MKIIRDIGSGPEAVYAYYFPSQVTGERWPIKIGRARRDVLARIKVQQASMHEAPEIALVIRTSNSVALEGTLHAALAAQRLPTFGREWYETSPDEIQAILALDEWDIPLHQQIRALRSERGLSQMQLADLTGLRQATISAAERGASVKTSTIEVIAETLGAKLSLKRV